MICPLMSRKLLTDMNVDRGESYTKNRIIAKDQDVMVECQKQNCMLWIKLINPITGTVQEGCAEALKAQMLNDIATELKRRPL